ncbi:hypothetical protein T492DRAFT_846563 [Pavlovales sp. CCMP2436]|nr:hypothetical protein T492DRAFT_846563 [Pavlovales sp. CCMP2436]
MLVPVLVPVSHPPLPCRENAAVVSQISVLESDKQQLELTCRALQKELTKLDSFKQSIISSIRDDSPYAPPGLSAASGLAPSASAARLLSPQAASNLSSTYNSYRNPGSASAPPPGPLGYSPYASGASAAPYAYGGSAPPPAAPYARSSPTSPIASQLGGPSGNGGAAYVDGKDFFRLARTRLSYEQFNSFLANIKSLNDHTQSRDVTLEQARSIFGSGNEDLFASFRSLLSHHGLV